MQRIRKGRATACFVAYRLEQEQGQARKEERFARFAGFGDGAGEAGIEPVAGVG
jgi:hypothetical protein